MNNSSRITETKLALDLYQMRVQNLRYRTKNHVTISMKDNLNRLYFPTLDLKTFCLLLKIPSGPGN